MLQASSALPFASALVAALTLSSGWAQAQGLRPDACAQDPRLEAVAARALRDGERARGEALRTEAWTAGLFAPSVYFWVGEGSEEGVTEAVDAWFARRARPGASARCAFRREGTRAAVVLVPRLLPLQVSWEEGASHAGELRWTGQNLSGARLLLQASSGDLREAPCEATRCRFRVEGEGGWTFQLVGDAGEGEQVWGAGPLRTVATEEEQAPTVEELPTRWHWLAALNRRRRSAGLEPLRGDPLLEGVAQRRAEELAAAGSVGHTLRSGDDPVRRLLDSGLAAERLGENVARARNLGEAAFRLEQSAAHRSLRRDASFDALGIGIANGGDGVYVVELLARGPRLRAR